MTWTLDTVHTHVGFAVKHMMVSTARGQFKSYTGTFNLDPTDFTKSSVEGEIDVASIDTNNPDRDNHLRTNDFFDVANHPKATFTSTKVERAADGKSTVTGNLTMKGQTKQISFPAVTTVEGDTVSATAEFAINRKDFNIVYAGKADDLIRDDVLVKLMIKAKKAV